MEMQIIINLISCLFVIIFSVIFFFLKGALSSLKEIEKNIAKQTEINKTLFNRIEKVENKVENIYSRGK